jgi:hypothetical protein
LSEWNEVSLQERQNHLVSELLTIFPSAKAKGDYHSKLEEEYVPIAELGETSNTTPENFMLFETVYPVESWKDLYYATL